MQTRIPQCRPQNATPDTLCRHIAKLCRSITFSRVGVLEAQGVDEVLGCSGVLSEVDIRDTEVEPEVSIRA